MAAERRRLRLRGTASPVPLFPSLAALGAGSLVWGMLMATSAVVSLYLRNRLETDHLAQLLALYLAGGMLAWPFVVLAARLVARNARLETRFAACLVLLATGTVAMTAFLFAMDYRLFYAQWHQPLLTKTGIRQVFGTFTSAVYQFAVLGLGLYLPVGLPVLAAVSLWLAKAMR
ncbi:hypothetical protein GGQ64_000219 [Rhizobium azooxidifex]|uniref:Uncharacterized protein n=1 Tax=Mycoplana azooxidifex TaxID=1636188 RepID=A0A7W6D8C6_9HYPH|nr:hypothetical protein [Mycoplana azooxidifex]